MADESKAAASASSASGAPPTKDFVGQANELLDLLDRVLAKYPFAQQLQEKTKLRPAYFAVGAVVLVLLFVLFGFGAAAVCSLTGFVYPLYASFKAIKTPGKDDDTMWLTYWIVYAFFTFVESFTDVLLRWIPFYYVFKVVFLVWSFLPQTRGASIVYKRFIFPVFIKYERQIDADIATLEKAAEKVEERVEGVVAGKKIA